MESAPEIALECSDGRTVTVRCSHTSMVPTMSLVEHPDNWNRHPAEQVRLIAKALVTHGFRVPITVSEDSGRVIRGHGRLMAARALGLEQVPVDEQSYASPEEELADLTADNRLAELSYSDDTALKSVLSGLDSGGYDMEAVGFSAEELDRFMEVLTPAVVEPKAKKGDKSKALSVDSILGDEGAGRRIIVIFDSESEQNDFFSAVGYTAHVEGTVVYPWKKLAGHDS